ncbi:MAG: pectate lyase [Longimicrobiaceae bacterium]
MTHDAPTMTRARRALLLAAVAAALPGCAARLPAQQQPRAERESALLAPARIAALPAAERQAWERYMAVSRQLAQADRDALAAELRAAGLEKATPAPHADGFGIEPRMTPEWFRGDEARRVADAIISFQTPAGGWSKRMEFTRPRRPGESWASEGNWSWVGTFDNGATVSQLRFLAGVMNAGGDERHRESFRRGLEYVFRAQFPTGCWPQVYPLVGSYHDAATFNDDAAVNVLRLLQDVAAGKVAGVGEAQRGRAAASLRRGVECVLASQVTVDGRRTAWGQQHDPLTLEPVGARAYEHRSLAGRESAAVVDLLMRLEPGDARVAAAVRAAVQWFRDTAVYGYEYAARGGLAPRPGAGPIWARFYEIGTNRPMFSNRDGVVRYAFAELEEERRTGYAWYTDEPATTLRRYEAWARRQAAAEAAATARPAARAPSAVVDAAHRGPDGAPVRGTRTFRGIGAALAAAPAPVPGGAPYVVHVRDGRYREKLSVDRPDVHLVGASREGTVLTYDAAAGMRSPGGWTYGTRGSWTLRVAAPGFRLERMTVENAFDYVGNAAKAEGDSTRVNGAQAVAVMLEEGSDRAEFRDCRLAGHQDTLFPNAGRSHFLRCTVLGSVDFIFGAGVAVFEDSDIVSRDRGSATSNGFVTAPSTPLSQPYGFVFLRSRLRKETPGMAPGSVTLGRPWHPSGNPGAVGSAVFIDTWMDDHVGARGWDPMNSTDAAGNRVVNRPENARFFEFGSTGPGAVVSPSRRVLSEAEARGTYALDKVLSGWKPVP